MFDLSFLDKTRNEKLLMQSYDLAFHDYAQLFPLIIGDDYEALLEDIDTNGQRAPIVLYEGKILDGRNRYRVCKDLLIELRIPRPSGHLFHEHPATDSTVIRPPVPRSSGHP